MPPTRSIYFRNATKNMGTRRKISIDKFSGNSKTVKLNSDEGGVNSLNTITEDVRTLERNNDNSDTVYEESTAQNHFQYQLFDIPCIDLAKKLLGKILVRVDDDGTVMRGKIVETECYLGGTDKASHSYNGKITPRNKPMFMKPGTTYVYFTYGMYHCINISSQGEGAAVLIRALEPVEGIDRILKYRMEFGKKKNSSTTKQDIKLLQLCNGPGKLCVGFNINKTLTELDLCSSNKIWIENEGSDIKDNYTVVSKRIGIDKVGEPWAGSLLRFYIYNCPFVSKRDKKQESIVKQNLEVLNLI